ncbi:MAG: ubiquitin carboxyl-terminal hydrolase family protein, partial [Bdellovibrionia bacterium]
AAKDNNFVIQWESVLSLGITKGLFTVQSLLQKALEPTPLERKEDDGRIVQYLLRERIMQAPDTLIIQLKRFAYDKKTGSMSKINQPIDFMPNLHLFESEIVRDLAGNPLQFRDKKEDIGYRIRGVVYHLGSTLQSGHYIYASFENNGDVIVHDDSRVSRYENIKSFQDLESHPTLEQIANNAYLLFFERIR